MSTPEINFLKGHPTHSLLPAKEIASAYEKVLLHTDYKSYETDPLNQHPLSYGTDPGNHDTRAAIAGWNDKSFGRSGTDPNCINLTGGASYGFANILASFTDVGSGITKRAFIVSPCYYLINGAFIDAGYEGKLTAINETPGQEYEIDLETLEQDLIKYSEGLELPNGKDINVSSDPCGRGEAKKYRFIIYIVPTFSNPGGLTYSVKTRLKLLELARKYDVLVASDDVYELLDYKNIESTPVPRVVYLDRDSLPSYTKYGNSISNATFSKLVAPGLRVGWQESATPNLVQQLATSGANKSGGTPGQLSTFVIKEFITTGKLDEIISKFKTVYKSRSIKLIACIKKYLPESTKLFGGDGGYFFWVDINADIDHRSIVRKLKQDYNITLASGDSFEVVGDGREWGRNCVRLSLSLLNEQQIEDGIRRWGDVLRGEHPQLFKTKEFPTV
ncbi:hypothetical protein CAAN1_16S03708 [[Candida] anglica]|uniref:Aminotransferase class I/classII large domain-containing protein n=1 Tax=[Candida] anglica TaxID=148631 RepID=A0ABP0EA47_9ASCO